MAKIIVPCDIIVKRCFRGYVTVDDDTSYAEICKAMQAKVLEEQDDCMSLCEEAMDIQPEDIEEIYPDIESAWSAEDDEEIHEIIYGGRN